MSARYFQDAGKYLAAIHVEDPVAQRILEKANRQLRKGVSSGRWRARRIFEDVFLRILWKLDPKVIRSIRWHHAFNFFRNLSTAMRGQGPQ